jgi:hypothetical protein
LERRANREGYFKGIKKEEEKGEEFKEGSKIGLCLFFASSLIKNPFTKPKKESSSKKEILSWLRRVSVCFEEKEELGTSFLV